METEKIIAMAVAAIAEESGVAPEHVNVLSFCEVQKPRTELLEYIRKHNISYHKYQLEGIEYEQVSNLS